MPDYPHIERYYEDKQRLIEFGGSDNEQNIRRAFENCLDSYCRDQREGFALVAELPAKSGVRPDGTVVDSLRLPRGYWEAKDLHDDLHTEIQRKLGSGYPNDNIIFENSRVAVLMQHATVSMQVDMSSPADLHRLITTFLTYVTREVEEFREAWRHFKDDLPTVLTKLREDVATAAATSESYQTAAAGFLDLCHRTIGTQVTEFDVQEMLIQHTLTKDIFLRVFSEDQFHQENNIARQLDLLERSFFTGDLRRETIGRLLPYYTAITAAAVAVSDYQEKQRFLKAIYEDFYKAYNPAAADRLGVVYTPNEVVDFIIRGTDYLLQKHFGRALADDNVQILDPATGTGTFVTSLIEYLPADRLEHKYRHEIHANEVAILPYYIANLNIEYSYKERTGRYLEFPNLCFVDTLDNLDWQKTGSTEGAVLRQGGLLLGGLSEENWIRVQEQNEKPISVIIGNPPYNANQQNENDNNKNREYPDIDRRISETYIAASTAQKTKQYDMYKRFIRWASDRLNDDGIVAFITNRAYLDTRQDDGFRQVAAKEFSELYIVDLGSDVRRNPKISGTTHNVFGIQTGVAIGFFVREKAKLGNFGIHYIRREDAELAVDKLAYLLEASLDEIAFEGITPDEKNNWLNQSNSDFDRLMPLANRQTKLAKTAGDEQAVFGLYSLGVVTNRDEWVYDFDVDDLGRKVRALINSYEETRATLGGKEVNDAELGTGIKWTRDLKRQLRLDVPNIFDRDSIQQTIYRPFVKKALYYTQNLNEMQYQLPQIFPSGKQSENRAICFLGPGGRPDFSVLATDQIPSLALFIDGTQCLPLYRYTADGERVSNITDWAVGRINEHYREEWGRDFEQLTEGKGITAEDIFAYTYAVLHDPVYRHDYAVDLLREFPRLPLYRDFDLWAKMGRTLLDLHLEFESAEPYPLRRFDAAGLAGRPILRADKERGAIVLDGKTTLTGVPESAWRYRLGSRSALEWVLDQYKEKKPRDPTIRDKFNTYRFADHKERVIELLQRVCTVSVNTMDVVDDMAYWDGDSLVVYGDRDKDEWAMLGLSQWFERPEDPEWEAAWSET